VSARIVQILSSSRHRRHILHLWVDCDWTIRLPGSNSICEHPAKKDPFKQSLQRLWEVEKTPYIPALNSADETFFYHFKNTHTVEKNGRYQVRLLMMNCSPSLGESKTSSIKRFLQNERSLKKRGKIEEFNDALQKYVDLNHVEPIHSRLSNHSIILPTYTWHLKRDLNHYKA